jgi:hypothetical protein
MIMIKKKSLLLLACSATAGLSRFFSQSASASSVIAYDNPAITIPSQSFPYLQDYTGALALNFTVETGKTIWVTYLGVFDNGIQSNLIGTETPASGVQVGIFSDTGSYTTDGKLHSASPVTGSLEGTSVTFNTSGSYQTIGGDVFKSIPAIQLSAGSYSVVSLGAKNYNTYGQPSGSIENSGGAISFTSATSGSNQTFDVPNGAYIDELPTNRYYAGTFGFSTTNPALVVGSSVLAVPLPKAASIGFWMLGGFGALAAIRKRLGRSPRIA